MSHESHQPEECLRAGSQCRAPQDSQTACPSAPRPTGRSGAVQRPSENDTYADLRSGATRLLEINHTLPAPADALYLVLSEPPAEDWSVDTIRDVFRVNVIWRSPTGWGGDNAHAAFGSSG